MNVAGDNGATFAYRDNRDNISSTLNGNLNSNMKIVVIDKDGLFFTGGASIDVQGIVATTGDVSSADVMDGGALTISNIENGGAIVNNGNISVADSGLAAFVAPTVVNNGVINAKVGNVVLAAAQTATIDLYGDGLVSLAASGTLNDALIENNGQILAEGGNVQITAQAAKATLDKVINNTGLISASSATVSGGKIILSGGSNGTIANAGKIETSDGGQIDVTGERFEQSGSTPVVVTAAADLSALVVPVPTVNPSIVSGGADINITTSGNVEIESGVVDAQGGNIVIDNGGVFHADEAEVVKTTGTGAVSINQNKEASVSDPVASIQNVIDAIENTGTGTNTINVGAGEFAESLKVDLANTILNGANSGISGNSARGAETIISPFSPNIPTQPNKPGFYVTADNVVIDGFEVNIGNVGVHVAGADNVTIQNNYIHDQFSTRSTGNSQGGFATGDGIYVEGSTGTDIFSNLIENFNDDGVHARNVVDLTIADNVINDNGEGDEGIAIDGSAGTLNISGNTINNSRRDGIQVLNASGFTNISENIVSGAHVSGIQTSGITGTLQIDSNSIDAVKDGIRLDGVLSNGTTVNVNNNTVNAGFDGVRVDASTNRANINLTNNDITAGDDAIEFSKTVSGRSVVFIDGNSNLTGGQNGIAFWNGINNSSVTISNNDSIIANAADGIVFGPAAGVSMDANSRVVVKSSDILASKGNGINVTGSVLNGTAFAIGAYEAPVVINAGKDGVRIDGEIRNARVRISDSDITGKYSGVSATKVRDDGVLAVWYNQSITGTLRDGVHVGSVTGQGGNGLSVVGNYNISGADDGVEVGYVSNANVIIVDNHLIEGGNNGIYLSDGLKNAAHVLIGEDGVDIYDTVIRGYTGSGIRVEGLSSADSTLTIGTGSLSTVSNATNTNYSVNALAGSTIYGGTSGISAFDMNNITINDNKISSELDGVYLFNADNVLIDGNEVTNASNGIVLADVNDVVLNGNTIANNLYKGLWAFGYTNGSIGLTNNVFLDNATGARFESGLIDVSDVLNPNTFQLSAGYTAPVGFPVIGMQFDQSVTVTTAAFDEAPISIFGGELKIVNETLGSTIFDGYASRAVGDSYYVRFEDGSILDPITFEPILIDGSFASWDGVVPDEFGNLLPASVLQAIEDRLYDADDAVVNGRGQIFVGDALVVPTTITLDNFQDFFRSFGFGNFPSGPAQTTILGLPSIGNFGGQGLNLGGIEPAAGGDGQNVANIEPAAGGDEPQGGEGGQQNNSEQASCWGDAVNALGQNAGGVTLNLGGSLEDGIQAATDCQTAQL